MAAFEFDYCQIRQRQLARWARMRVSHARSALLQLLVLCLLTKGSVDTIVILLAQKYLRYRPERLILLHHFILAPLLFIFLQYVSYEKGERY